MTSITPNLHFYIITGGPGVGKTTLLEELELRGYTVVPEVAREIIREQMETGGDALPWANTERYKQMMLDRSVRSYRSAERQKHAGPVFFDRGIPDTLCYERLLGSAIHEATERAVRECLYNPTVFLLPPWEEIYTTDTERKQDWEEVLLTHRVMMQTYRDCGYEVVEVPRVAVWERAEFVLERCEGTGPLN